VWSPAKGKRFRDATSKGTMPDMGTYNPTDIDSTSGSYLVSKFRSMGTKKFVQESPRGGYNTNLSFISRTGKIPSSHL